MQCLNKMHMVVGYVFIASTVVWYSVRTGSHLLMWSHLAHGTNSVCSGSLPYAVYSSLLSKTVWEKDLKAHLRIFIQTALMFALYAHASSWDLRAYHVRRDRHCTCCPQQCIHTPICNFRFSSGSLCMLSYLIWKKNSHRSNSREIAPMSLEIDLYTHH